MGIDLNYWLYGQIYMVTYFDSKLLGDFFFVSKNQALWLIRILSDKM